MNLPAVTIRAYRPADLDTLIELFRGSIRRVARRDYSVVQVMAWAPDDIDRDNWIGRIANRSTWVAEIAGEFPGFTDLEPDGHLDRMYTHADHQGRGVASALLRELEVAARTQKISRLFTEASITARPFFERRGFRLITAQTVRFNGQTFINHRMEKLLSLD